LKTVKSNTAVCSPAQVYAHTCMEPICCSAEGTCCCECTRNHSLHSFATFWRRFWNHVRTIHRSSIMLCISALYSSLVRYFP